MRKFFFVYALLLITSNIFLGYWQPQLPAGQTRLSLNDGVAIAYVDTASGDRQLPVVLLIHGSPVDVPFFAPLIERLRHSFRVVAPALPGFGASTREIPDYSIRAHAAYLNTFLQKGGFPPVHVVGYSMGSGVAIELAHLAPQRLASLTLLSGIGAQEHELLGNYYLNHVLHGLQLAFFWAIDRLVPHFGVLRSFPLNYYYARNFYDTDQRPLKKYLSENQLPALIVHGGDDMMVPLAAAHTHKKLMPHSELRIFPGEGHLMVWEKSADVAAVLKAFIGAHPEPAPPRRLSATEQELKNRALQTPERFENSAIVLVLLALAIPWLVIRVFLPLCTWRGRRLLYSSYLRLTRWEFWPAWLFYIPLGFYFVYLAVRYRGLTVFTAANPAIPDGGVIGESKSDILKNLSGAGKNVARFILLGGGMPHERLRMLSDFLRRQKLRYPVVLKPDVGERGNDVAVIRTEAEALSFFERHSEPTIAQEYISGLEFGVFYFRMPQSPQGTILAITDKRFPALAGDGKSTLEQVILSDERAVTMARFHLKKFAARLSEVIPAGEKIQLVELGTHCKGSLFLDGMHLCTPALAEAIDCISRSFDGFYFGRYDIRVPSLDDFRKGKHLKVLELNGVTSEATSIYDPANPLRHAYRVLAKQWKIAFAIGRQNIDRGFPATGVLALVRRLIRHT